MQTMTMETNRPPKKRKHDLPSFYKMKNIHFDLNRLKEDALRLEEHYCNVYESNKSFCANNSALAEAVYSHFDQVSLTDYKFDDQTPFPDQCESLGRDPSENNLSSRSKIESYKMRISDDCDPRLIERNYTKPSPLLAGTYIEESLKQFKAPVTRVRLVRLKAGCLLPAHIDYDPSYAVRLLVPIFTNKHCVNMIWRRGQLESRHLEADGHPWFLNVGYAHGVGNFGKQDRVTLMISLDGQDDIQEL